MQYKTWMIKHFINDKSMKGKLARDIKEDKKFPQNGLRKFDGWHTLILSYLLQYDASSNCLKAFEETWDEYEDAERKRLKMSPKKR